MIPIDPPQYTPLPLYCPQCPPDCPTIYPHIAQPPLIAPIDPLYCPHSPLWVSMGPYRPPLSPNPPLLSPIDPLYCPPFTSMGSYWVPMGPYRPPLAPHSPLWVPIGVLGCVPPPYMTLMGPCRRRMQGWTVLWVPGTDHAGIATQAVVERWLWQQKGVRRQDLTRSEFMDEMWGWGPIGRFLPVLWMSRGLVCGLHRCGLVHRDTRLVNWSCALQSAVADIEVSPRPIPGPTSLRVPGCPHPVTFGVMVTFAYPVEGDDGESWPHRRPHRGPHRWPHSWPHRCRSGDVIEFLLKSNGSCACREMAQRALSALWDTGGLMALPQCIMGRWRTNGGSPHRDWCLSRQLWWGHRVPAYKVGVSPPPHHCDPPPLPGLWVVAHNEDEAREEAARLYSAPYGDIEILQVTSQLPPIFTPKSPFDMGKMSKSIGNVIDPRDVIGGATLQELQEKLRRTVLDPHELKVASKRQFPHGIPECGTDALRLALCSHNAHGDDIKLDVAAILKQRHFCNKVWNAVKFVLTFRPHFNPKPPHEVTPSTPMDRWVLSRLAGAVVDYGKKMEALEVHGAMAAMQNFWLRSFCDVYLESIKPSLRRPDPDPTTLQTLLTCTELGLRLLAPFAPFLAEELWHRLPRDPPGPPTLCLAPFPSAAMLAHWICPEVEEEVEAMREVVRTVRALRDVFRLGAARPRGEWPRWTQLEDLSALWGLVDPDIERTRLQTQILTLQRRLRALPPPQQSQVRALIN
uniref:valine--tRNA ligase n=1 Tax=Coturnix japonica TaxID=93934 RepID=A0A8C2T2E2_COTJA